LTIHTFVARLAVQQFCRHYTKGKVSGGGDDGGRNEDAPIAIVSQERQRAEGMKMRFDPSAG